jgi:cation diffusion facilitator CzcD-associated flavoprotein CzcO
LRNSGLRKHYQFNTRIVNVVWDDARKFWKVTTDRDQTIEATYCVMGEAARNSPNGGVRPWTTRAFFSVTPSRRRELLEDAWKSGGLAMLGTFTDLLSNEEANAHVAEFVRDKIDDVVKDSATAEALKPRGYPIFARRPCLDTEYYETFNQPNVQLMDCVDDPIL